jgi:CheY-like chemotaxis protein
MYADLPILIASSEAAEAMGERFAGDRCVAVISKPYSAAKLQAALDKLRARCGASVARKRPDAVK